MHRMVTVAATSLLIVGCGEQPTQLETFDLPVIPHAAVHAPGGVFGTPLSAAEEVMPAGVVNESRARGNAVFQLSRNAETMSFRLIVANIENVTMAHIHLGASGANGPPIVWLYPSVDARAPAPSGGGRTQGVIGTGEFAATDFVGPLAGATMAELVEVLRAGNAYVNVHTNDGADPSNTGPGDFPGGEIRGQIRQRGH
jgi:hypothetical protein